MMSGLFVIAGFMMFGCFAMMLGRVLMMLRGVLVVLMNLVIVHGSLSRHLEKTGSIAAFDEPFATPRCQIGASAALRRAAGAFAELRPRLVVPSARHCPNRRSAAAGKSRAVGYHGLSARPRSQRKYAA
jgi:hypothetical protein